MNEQFAIRAHDKAQSFGRQLAKGMAALAVTLLSMQAAHAADWYVDGANGNNRNTGALSAPFKEVWRAWQYAQPGDTIHLLPTVVYGPLYFGNGHTGLPGAYITIKGEGATPNLTKVSGMGKNFGIYLAEGVNYINIQNLDVSAPSSATGYWSAIFLKQNHHVNITNNYAHDAGCSGIQTQNSDYVNIMLNRVANNAKDTFQNIYCSGISTHENLDSDNQTGYKIWIQNNIVYGNTNRSPANCLSVCLNSDGNGIIIDDNKRSQTDGRSFKGRTVVQNNVIFNNGGRGITVYYSNNVDVWNNTVFKNNRDPNEGAWRPGEIGVSFSGGVNVTNNILYTDGLYGSKYTGNHVAVSVQDNTSGGPVVVDHNLMYAPNGDTRWKSFTRNNTVPVNMGSNNKWGDPLFKTAAIDPAIARFEVMANSAALNIVAPAGLFAQSDINWAPRYASPTAGAYQKPVK